MQLKWNGRSYRPANAVKVYKPDINELMKPLSDKSAKGTIFMVAQSINPQNKPSITPSVTPSVTPTNTVTPTPTNTPTPSSSPSLDPDAQAFITAANVTGATEQNAIDVLVKGLKSDLIWNKLYYVYPFIGPGADQNKYNLKDPQDTNAAGRLTYAGGITHNTSGMTGNAGNGVANMNRTASQVFTSATDMHLSIYINSDFSTNLEEGHIGGDVNNLILFTQYTYASDVDSFGTRIGSSSTVKLNGNTTPEGFYLATKNGSNVLTYKNNVFYHSGTTATNTLDSVDNILFLSLFNPAVPGYTSGQRYGWISLGGHLTTTEKTNLYNRVQTYQTTLNRNI